MKACEVKPYSPTNLLPAEATQAKPIFRMIFLYESADIKLFLSDLGLSMTEMQNDPLH